MGNRRSNVLIDFLFMIQELVTFRSDPLLKPPEISHAGKHLSATEFHSVLQDAGI